MNTETFEHTDSVALPPLEERPVHLARCVECGHSVAFRPNSTGTGFVLVGTDATYGVGDNGRPICPDGHGEMEIADDRLPIEQAMEQAAAALSTQRLPFPVPAFNYEGVLHALCEKRHEIATLEKRVNDRKDLLKKAKDDLDGANAELGKMIDQFEHDEQDRIAEMVRREARAAAGHPADTNLVRCAWEQAHPDEDCPMCADEKLRPLAPDAALHVEQVDRYLHLQESDEIVALVSDAGIRLMQCIVDTWSAAERAAVKAWAEIENGLADKPADHQRPAILGTAHVAQDAIVSDAVPGDTFQCCRECGARLVTVKTGSGEDLNAYPGGTLVGTDCPGASAPRYPKRGRKKAAKS